MSHVDPESLPKPLVARTAPVTVLFVEANIEVARLVERTLLGAGDGAYRVEWVTSLARALENAWHVAILRLCWRV